MGEPDDARKTVGTPLAAYATLRDIALSEYPTVVAAAVVERGPGDVPRNLRIFFVDDGFLDVWLSEDKYSYHWQSEDSFVRFDNAPHHDHLDTHPHHQHEDDAVTESPLGGSHVDDFPQVMDALLSERLP